MVGIRVAWSTSPGRDRPRRVSDRAHPGEQESCQRARWARWCNAMEGTEVDDKQFDGLIRALGSGTSRRGALGLLAAAAGLGLREVSRQGQAPPQRQGEREGQGEGEA